jgi:hypothetical protein
VRIFDRPPAIWPYGDALWRGWVRALPSGAAGFTPGTTLGLYLLWGPDDLHAAAAVVFLGLAGAALSFALMVTVALFNWPRFVVPPHLREQPGAVTEWIAGSRRRRGTSGSGK